MIPEKKGMAIWGQSSEAKHFNQGTILLSAGVIFLEDKELCTMMYE